MRLIDADDKENITIVFDSEGRGIIKRIDAPTVQAIPIDVLDKIRAEIAEYKDNKIIHDERNEMIDIVLDIIDKYRESEET